MAAKKNLEKKLDDFKQHLITLQSKVNDYEAIIREHKKKDKKRKKDDEIKGKSSKLVKNSNVEQLKERIK